MVRVPGTTSGSTERHGGSHRGPGGHWGRRDVASFCINLRGRLMHIRCFPVPGPSGGYFRCLQVTQDITDIKTIQPEKRLLWL